MRYIKAANIKVDAFLMAATKKNAGNITKNDFVEQLESFLAKDKKTESESIKSKEVATEKEDDDAEGIEEDFDTTLTINLVDLNHLVKHSAEVKTQASLLGENTELLTEEIAVDSTNFSTPIEEAVEINPNSFENTKDIAFNLEELVSENAPIKLADAANPIGQAQVEKILLEIETRLNENPEFEVKDIIEGLLSKNERDLTNVFENFDIESIENISQIELETISAKNKPTILEDHEINDIAGEGIEEVSIEQTQVTTVTKNRELILENDGEPQEVELSTLGTFESFNRLDFTTETSTSIQSVAQEDFISNVETLMIEETNALDGGEKVTTARIQLTPERLGKVDLQIEINGKELTAKLFVEQKETKQWIDHQLAHLKEKLLTQEITLKDFQVVVHEENLNDTFMSSEDNPFFKQKEKDSQARKEQRLLKSQGTDESVQREKRSYSTRNGISIFV